MAITRMMVFSPQDSYLFDISPKSFFGGSYTEEINGQHSMSMVTLQKLEKEQRILFEDATEKWREYVVTGVDEAHQNNERVFGQYQLVWSLQHDLQLYNINELAGDDELISTAAALDIVLSGTLRWNRGEVNVDSFASAEMVMKSGWESLSILLNTWGGEVDADIQVSSTGIVSRKVNISTRLGSEHVTRRFDYSRDLVGFKRNVDESPIACQIVPLGKSEKDFEGFDVPLTIEDVNDGVRYLRNDETAPLFRLPDGNGGWEYTEIQVQNTSIEDEEELLEWGLSVLDEYTRPKVTYEAEVLQFVAAGMDAKGVELGDPVHCVDREFGGEGVRVEGRVVSITVDLADPSKTSLTVGYLKRSSISSVMSSITSVKSEVTNLAAGVTYTTDYLNNLLDNLNAEINVTGGWTYVTRDQGFRTYDKAVSDPAVGAEADAVVEVKGGTIRIANTKDATGQWEWRTVFTAGLVASDVLTADNLTVGTIGNAEGGTYWDLDNHVFRIGLNENIGDKNVGELLQDVDDARRFATDYLLYENGELILGATDSVIKNVMTNSRNSFRTNAGDVAWFGLNSDNIWELYIDTASILNRLNFGKFAWIARDNGNMTLKWTGN